MTSGPLPPRLASVVREPGSIPSLDPSEVHELLDRWFATYPARAVEEVPERKGESALVFGDTHSDWPTTLFLAERAFSPSEGCGWVMATGDYVDRAPPELPYGSAINAVLLLSLQLAHPGRAVFLRGNHETQRAIPVLRREVDDEATQLWGPESRLGGRIEDAFDRWPLAACTSSGAYLAHAGFPRTRPGGGREGWKKALAHPSVEVLEEVVWNDLDASAYQGGRGLSIPAITEAETLEFLKEAGLTVFLRGHDPSDAGRARFHDRVLTLHTSRIYDWAGLHWAKVPLDRPIRDLRDVDHRTLTPPPIPATAPAASGRRTRYPK